ncbi:PepSY domain-containing protein [Sulfitobacter sp.]|uniref:PepSY domain-containing protein n=1 Tax=Sulfitobacter sp. TaxID=1903071 RepID=UPI003567A577
MKKHMIVLTTALVFAATAILADDDDDERHGLNALLEARRAGQVLPLISILTRVQPITGDNVVDIEFEQENGRFKYGIYYIDDRGHRREVYVDAQTGAVLKNELAD